MVQLDVPLHLCRLLRTLPARTTQFHVERKDGTIRSRNTSLFARDLRDAGNPQSDVFLSVALPANITRWLNIILGLAYTLIEALTMPGSWSYYLFDDGAPSVWIL